MRLEPPQAPELDLVVAAAQRAGVRSAQLVGGAVRDRLRTGAWGPVPDLDVVFEGDALAVARALGGDVVLHAEFGTATWRSGDAWVDLVTARTETYPQPGSLPVVSFGDLEPDLRRRDVTVNAIALQLWPDRGVVIDPLGGVADLEAGILRAHHAGSFVDDATRLLRAARYAVRLGLTADPETEGWFASAAVAAISGDRWFAEWRQLLAEDDPNAVLRWLGERGLASALGLRADAPDLRPLAGIDGGALGALALAAASPRPLNLSEHRVAPLAALQADPPVPDDPLDLEGFVRRHGPLYCAVRATREPSLAPRLVRGADLAAQPPLLLGRDLLARGLPPGPAVGRALRRVHEARRREGVSTPEAALALLESEGAFDDA